MSEILQYPLRETAQNNKTSPYSKNSKEKQHAKPASAEVCKFYFKIHQSYEK